jgi:hypothetical protein
MGTGFWIQAYRVVGLPGFTWETYHARDREELARVIHALVTIGAHTEFKIIQERESLPPADGSSYPQVIHAS